MIVGITFTLITFIICSTVLLALRMRTVKYLQQEISSAIAHSFRQAGLKQIVYDVLVEDGLITGEDK